MQRGHHRGTQAARPGPGHEKLELIDDLAHALGERAYGFQILVCRGILAALQKHARIVREAAQGRQRLVQLVRNARRHLAERHELAGLDQFVLGGAQLGLGAHALVHLALQILIGLQEIGRAFGDALVEHRVGLLQHCPALYHFLFALAPLPPVKAQQA